MKPHFHLRTEVGRALRWSVVGRFSSQLVAWTSTLLVIRLLTPADYGFMAAAMLLVSVALIFNEVGLASAIVRTPNLTRREIQVLQGAILTFNLTLFLLVIAIAPLASMYFGTDITAITRTMALVLIFRGLGAIHEAVLIRDFGFRSRSLVEMISTVLGSLLTLPLAMAGYGVWSLVWGQLMMNGTRAIGFSVLSPHTAWPSFAFSAAWPHLRFGFAILAQRMLFWLNTKIDVLVLARVLDPTLLGAYAVAKTLASLPNSKLGSALNQVGLATYTRLQDEPDLLKSVLGQASQLLLLVSLPTFALMSALAPEIQAAILGPAWVAARVPLMALSLTVPLVMIGTQINEALNALGRPTVVLVNQITTSVLLIFGVLVGSSWDLVGVALAWFCIYPIAWTIAVGRAQKYTRLGVADILFNSRWAILGTVFLYIGVSGIRSVLMPMPSLARLLVLAGAGGTIYFLTLVALDRAALRKAMAFLLSRKPMRTVRA